MDAFQRWVMESYREILWHDVIRGRMRDFRDLGGMGR